MNDARFPIDENQSGSKRLKRGGEAGGLDRFHLQQIAYRNGPPEMRAEQPQGCDLGFSDRPGSFVPGEHNASQRIGAAHERNTYETPTTLQQTGLLEPARSA